MVPNIRPSGNTFAGLQNGGLVDHIEQLITVNAVATVAPTAAPTATATGGGSTGGALAVGTYLLTFTEVNGIGETTASPESATLTVGSTNIPRVTFPSLKTGNTGRNLYVTAAGGTTGTETLYASNITTTTFDMAVAAPASQPAAPTVNTTALTSYQINAIRLGRTNALQGAFFQAQNLVGSFLRGDPMATAAANQMALNYSIVFAVLATAMAEVTALILANPGTIVPNTGAIGGGGSVRIFP